MSRRRSCRRPQARTSTERGTAKRTRAACLAATRNGRPIGRRTYAGTLPLTSVTVASAASWIQQPPDCSAPSRPPGTARARRRRPRRGPSPARGPRAAGPVHRAPTRSRRAWGRGRAWPASCVRTTVERRARAAVGADQAGVEAALRIGLPLIQVHAPDAARERARLLEREAHRRARAQLVVGQRDLAVACAQLDDAARLGEPYLAGDRVQVVPKPARREVRRVVVVVQPQTCGASSSPRRYSASHESMPGRR